MGNTLKSSQKAEDTQQNDQKKFPREEITELEINDCKRFCQRERWKSILYWSMEAVQTAKAIHGSYEGTGLEGRTS